MDKPVTGNRVWNLSLFMGKPFSPSKLFRDFLISPPIRFIAQNGTSKCVVTNYTMRCWVIFTHRSSPLPVVEVIRPYNLCLVFFTGLGFAGPKGHRDGKVLNGVRFGGGWSLLAIRQGFHPFGQV